MRQDDLDPEQAELLGLLLGDDEPPASAAISRHPGGPAPLSYAQRQLYLVEQLFPGTGSYLVGLGVRLTGALQPDALTRALQQLLERNTALRTRFLPGDGEPVQEVVPAARLAVPTVDLRHLAAPERDQLLAQVTREELSRPFDLAAGLLLRTYLFALQDDEHVLLAVTHHINADAWSMAVFARDLIALYDAFASGRPDPLPAPAVQMIDVAAWERRHRVVRPDELAWWRDTLADAPPLALPTDRPRPARPDFAGARVHFELPRDAADGLRALARQTGATLYAVVLAGLLAVFARHAGHDDIVVGTPIAARGRPELERAFGVLVDVLALRTRVDLQGPFRDLVLAAAATVRGALAHKDVPFELVVDELRRKRDASHNPVFQVSYALFAFPDTRTSAAGLTVSAYPLPSPSAKFDLTVDLWDDPRGTIHGYFEYATALWDEPTIARMRDHLRTLLIAAAAAPQTPVYALPLLTPSERHALLVAWNATQAPIPAGTIHAGFFAAAERLSQKPAVIGDDLQLDYRGLADAARLLAARLHAAGVRRGDRVGVCVRRGAPLIVALLGALRAGAAYVPLDPEFPAERSQWMLADAGVAALISDGSHAALGPVTAPILAPLSATESPLEPPLEPPPDTADADDLAYVLYTSGSTGRPRGVAVRHRNVQNFFAGMDDRIGDAPGVWLAVTSAAFDISVLELLWTLTRGFTVVVQPTLRAAQAPAPAADLRLGLMFFSSEATAPGRDAYRLVLDGARIADETGLAAVWLPERHFDRFGGLFPNPSVIAAALAATTRRISLRAGSVVLPLHHPVRVVEEWSVVDNLSDGRVELAFASGWHADDFVLAPADYSDRRARMIAQIDELRRLWRGEPVTLPGGAGPVTPTTYPRPVQREPPLWLTAAGNPETFRLAGELGFSVLTHLLGQDPASLADKIASYRAAWRSAGHPGQGRVALMLHTLLADDDEAALSAAEEPFLAYLRSSLDLFGRLVERLAPGSAAARLSPEDADALLRRGYRRLVRESGLFGSPDSARPLLHRLAALGVDEIACLIDFGVPTELALAGVRRIAALQAALRDGGEHDLAATIRRHGVTHLQCTPSLLRLTGTAGLAGLSRLLLGGEALPPDLLDSLPDIPIDNMYGPTETTIWSTTGAVRRGEPITLGRPIRNTRLYVVDAFAQPVPIGVPGELWIGGAGVASGYWNLPEPSAARFITDPFVPGERVYRTGDRVRWLADGRLQYLGRDDDQIKLRGHRVEPGEVEAALARVPGVAQAVVVARPDPRGELRLIAYLVPHADADASLVASVQAAARAALPAYLVPALFVVADALPLTPNGKIDRKALPDPDELTAPTPHRPPEGALEATLARLFAEVLARPQVSRDADFFALGGHSLLAAHLVGRIEQELGTKLPLITMLEHPTVQALATKLSQEAGAP
jgi:natural product biosynthesis luciferase-like monooxygenase protein